MLRHLFVFGAGSAIVGIRMDGDTSARGKQSDDLNVSRLHQTDKVFHYDVDTVFVEVAVIAELYEIQLKTLALNHFTVGDIANAYLCEVGLTGNGTQ